MNNVTFTSKMDRSFKKMFVSIIILLIGLFVLPFLFDLENMTVKDIYIVTGLCIATLASLTWVVIDITYEFKEDHLYLRAGFVFTRVRYEDIESYRHLNGIMDIGSGFTMVSSTKGIAILSQKLLLGEVKISPSDREGFIMELEKRMVSAK